MVYTRVSGHGDSLNDSEDDEALSTPFNTPAKNSNSRLSPGPAAAGAAAAAMRTQGRATPGGAVIDLTASSSPTGPQPTHQQGHDDLLGLEEPQVQRGGHEVDAHPPALPSHRSVSTPELAGYFDPFSSGEAPAMQPPLQSPSQQHSSGQAAAAAAAAPQLHKSASATEQGLRHGEAGSPGTLGGEGVEAGASQAAEAVLDFEEEDGAREHRELLLYALPLFQDEENPVKGLVFLPVSNFCEEKPDSNSMQGKMQARLDKMAAQWDQLKEKEEGTLGKKIYKVGHSVVNDLTPEERLTRAIPKNVTKVIIYHPSTIGPDVIMDRLSSMTDKHVSWSSAKAAVATFMLPIAFGIDILVIPGPQVLTYYTAFQLYKNARSAVGTQRLTKLIKQEGQAATVRVNYAGDVRLDQYWEAVQHAHDGVLEEELCEQLVADIDQPDLLEPLLELRKRRLREQGTRSSSHGGADYQPLRSTEADASHHVSSSQPDRYFGGSSKR